METQSTHFDNMKLEGLLNINARAARHVPKLVVDQFSLLPAEGR